MLNCTENASIKRERDATSDVIRFGRQVERLDGDAALELKLVIGSKNRDVHGIDAEASVQYLYPLYML